MYRTTDIARRRFKDVPLFLNVVSLCLLAVFALAPAACGTDSTTSPPSEPSAPPPPAPVATRIEVAPQSVNLTAIGQTEQIQATVYDQNGAAMSGAPVSWTSNNAAVASVNATGLVKAAGNGAAQVTARTGNLSAHVAVSVSQTTTRIGIMPAAPRLRSIGETVQLAATGLDSGGNAVAGDAPDVTWQGGDEAVATVTAEGLVTAVGNGAARITARSGSLTAAVTVTVEQQASRIVVMPAKHEFTALEETFQFEAEAFDANGHALESGGLTWRSSDETVASVDEAGLVTARGEGTAQILASRDGESATAAVSVRLPSPDRAVLVTFYEATGGPQWTRDTNWLSDRPLDEWFGVTTDDDERVMELVLSDNNLTGSLPSELGELTRLRDLLLGSNKLTGPVPGELGLLPDLWNIGLSANNLTGSIPRDLGRSPSLYGLQLDYNNLTGEIPPELGQLTDLRDLQLNDNQLTGPIPPELGRLTELSSLFLDYNMLSGTIPPTLGNLVNVYRLELNNNRLTGEIPPELGKMTGMLELFLDNNMLSGSLPEELGALPELNLIFVGLNRDLAGPLPRSFLNLDLRYLRLEGTNLCYPADDAFMAWIEGIEDSRALPCEPDDQE